MKKSVKRVLARRLATNLAQEALHRICGDGTSYTGTGSCDAQGRAQDIQAVDCCLGDDTFKC